MYCKYLLSAFVFPFPYLTDVFSEQKVYLSIKYRSLIFPFMVSAFHILRKNFFPTPKSWRSPMFAP